MLLSNVNLDKDLSPYERRIQGHVIKDLPGLYKEDPWAIRYAATYHPNDLDRAYLMLAWVQFHNYTRVVCAEYCAEQAQKERERAH